MTGFLPLRSQEYATNIEMLSQQLTARLAPFTRMQTGATGKAIRMLSQVSSTNTVDVTTSATPAMNIDVNFDGRWVYPRKKGWGSVIDDLELLQTNISPQGVLVQSAVAALQRDKDNLFLSAFFGDSQTGETGATTTSFNSNNVVAQTVGSTTGLNVDKIRTAMKVLLRNNVNIDMEQVYCGITSTQWFNLTGETIVTSRDFAGNGVNTTGKLPNLYGMNFVITEYLPTDASGYRRCPVWVTSGMGQAIWKDISGRLRSRGDLFDDPSYAEASMQVGFTRLEEAKCVEIKCAES